MQEQEQNQLVTEPCREDVVKIPKWAWALLVRLLTVLLLGAGITLLFIIWWLFVLTKVQLTNAKTMKDIGTAVKKIAKKEVQK